MRNSESGNRMLLSSNKVIDLGPERAQRIPQFQLLNSDISRNKSDLPLEKGPSRLMGRP